MKHQSDSHDRRALVTVFEDMPAAIAAVKALTEAGFDEKQLELVTDRLDDSSGIETPEDRAKAIRSLVKSAEYWGAFGAGAGALAGTLATIATPFPGAAIGGLMVMGGLTGALLGSLSGAEQVAEDDSANLPTMEQYQKLLAEGHDILIVHGTHDEVARAKRVLEHLPCVHRHIHPLRGHEFHEHPSRESEDGTRDRNGTDSGQPP